MHRTILALLFAMLMTAPLALAEETTGTPTTLHLTVVALDEACPDGKTFCYDITEGSLEEVHPGQHVVLTFENHGASEHELMVRTLGGDLLAPAMSGTSHEGGAHGDSTHDQDAETDAHTTEEHEGNASHDEGQPLTHANETDGNATAHDENASAHDEGGHGEMAETSHMEGGHEAHIVAPGGSMEISFTVPEHTEGIEFWCSLPGHVESGMITETTFSAQSHQASADGGHGGEGEHGGDVKTPLAMFFGLAIVAIAVVTLRWG
ncbi:MAG: hypothetical protein R3185_03300 [Candidatus Thermoplasmatota archaeon]|nr:hypothetical protein [Candidatus Thermoplasmatota archaeon]